MARKIAGAGGMPAEKREEAVPKAEGKPSEMPAMAKEISAEMALQPAEETNFAHDAGAFGQNAENAEKGTAGQGAANGDFSARQPDFRVVQPEYLESEGKTIFKDVGALWKNISRKTGREFYTMKIGKLKLLVFPNQKIGQNE